MPTEAPSSSAGPVTVMGGPFRGYIEEGGPYDMGFTEGISHPDLRRL